jgi:D-alanine transaminase
MVYLQITRGVAMRDHAMPPDIAPTVFGMVNRLYIYSAEERAKGVMCVTADDFRWKKAHIKSTSLAGAVLSRQMSADVGGNETIMFRDGWLSEASSSNVWVVKDGVVLGPRKDNLVLEGIRYGLLEELCRAAGVPFELRPVSREEVLGADEILLSSATKEVMPCTVLDGKPVGNGRPGPMYERLFAGYQQAKRS